MREFTAGLRHLKQGFGFWGRRPKVMFLGAIPALLAALVLGAALVLLAVNISDLAAAATGFADGWSDAARVATRVAVGVAAFGLAIWLCVVLFAWLTLLIGDPFYEAVSARVEDAFGGAASVEESFWESLGKSLSDAARLLGKSLLAGVAIFALNCVPLVGQVVAFTLGILVGGWFMAVELTGYAFNRRGLRYRQYRPLLRRRRGMACGFGVPVFLLFLIPFGAVATMPAAVAGATLLARDVLGEPAHLPPGPAGPARR
ncbi:MAG: EI24 domain-containing protein [Stackebrandtia sp.]